MHAANSQHLSGGFGKRPVPAGARAGAPLTRIDGPEAALALVAEPLLEAEGELRALVRSEVAAVAEVAAYLTASGGKRLRPALTALGAGSVGYAGRVARLMCVGELIHLGSLLHDDVVDDADVRRGRPAAHVVHGNAVSVLTGDFCLARAVLLSAEEGGFAAVSALSRAVTEMAEGEVLQLNHAGDLDNTLERYFDTVDKKSAALIAWCCAAGALAAGDSVAAGALEAFGRAVGVAFQIADDVLDYESGTGKSPGADLRERKVTLPLLFAMERISGLRDRLRSGPPDDVSSLIVEIRQSGALEAARAVARSRVDAGLHALTVLPDSPYRDALTALGRHLVERSA